MTINSTLKIQNLKSITRCLFPVAGLGTRFLPVTKTIPKEMLPILTKPLIEYGVEEALSSGIKNMAMVTSKDKKAIEEYFESGKDCKFSYIRQQQMLGLGHAILTAQPLIGDEAFAVILPDDLCLSDNDNVLKQMIKVYEKYKCCVVAIEEIAPKDSDKYGIIKGDLIEKNTYQVSDMVEKPKPQDAPSNLAIIGRYILIPNIFNILKNTQAGKGGEIQITDALLELAKRGQVIGYKFDGKRFDCGSVKGYVEANNHFAKAQNII